MGRIIESQIFNLFQHVLYMYVGLVHLVNERRFTGCNTCHSYYQLRREYFAKATLLKPHI